MSALAAYVEDPRIRDSLDTFQRGVDSLKSRSALLSSGILNQGQEPELDTSYTQIEDVSVRQAFDGLFVELTTLSESLSALEGTGTQSQKSSTGSASSGSSGDLTTLLEQGASIATLTEAIAVEQLGRATDAAASDATIATLTGQIATLTSQISTLNNTNAALLASVELSLIFAYTYTLTDRSGDIGAGAYTVDLAYGTITDTSYDHYRVSWTSTSGTGFVTGKLAATSGVGDWTTLLPAGSRVNITFDFAIVSPSSSVTFTVSLGKGSTGAGAVAIGSLTRSLA